MYSYNILVCKLAKFMYCILYINNIQQEITYLNK